MKRCYKLDNIANLYSAVTNKKSTCVFRLSAILTEKIDPKALQQAADVTIKRFPTIDVKLYKGLFWNYFHENDNLLVVQEESTYPCGPIMGAKENNEYLFRILYYERRLTLECSHALTDGKGAMEFLKSLIYKYLLLIGKEVQDEGMILLPKSTPEQEEGEDGCLRYYKKNGNKLKNNLQKARTIQGKTYIKRRINVTHGIIPIAPLNAYAREHGTTITGYLTTVFAMAISLSDSQQNQSPYPIQISIPVNLRGFFPSKTLRNFVSQIIVSIPTASEQNFDELVKSVTKQMKQSIKKENFSDIIKTYVGYEKTLIGRIAPWFVKKAIINFVSKRSENKTTAILTNLGNIKLPKSMEQYIDMIEAVPPLKESSSINCGICSVSGNLNISFSSNIAEFDIIQCFFDLVAKQTGLAAQIYSNTEFENITFSKYRENMYPSYIETTPKEIKKIQTSLPLIYVKKENTLL